MDRLPSWKHGLDALTGFEDNPSMYIRFKEWCAREGCDLERSVAIGMWGDFAVISGRKSLYIMLCNVLSGSKAQTHLGLRLGKGTSMQAWLQM